MADRPRGESDGPPAPGHAIQTPGSFGDADATRNRKPPVPKNFRVTISPDGQHDTFIIADGYVGPARRVIDEYHIWFAPQSLLSDATTIKDPTIAASVFAGASLVDSMSASGRPGDITKEGDRKWFGKAGWFFATSVNDAGTESNPTPPVVAPGTSTGADSEIPPDVTGAQAELVAENVQGRPFIRVYVTAQVPSPIGSFAGYQIYLKGYRNNQLLEEGPFIGLTTQNAGDSLSGSFLLAPDVPSGYSTGLLRVTHLSGNHVGVGTNWNTAWGTERWIEFWAPTVSDARTLFRQHISSVSSPTALLATGSVSYLSGTYPYIIYDPAQQSSNTFDGASGFDFVRISHDVTLYFVAVSRAGTRRPDVENAPRVVFQFGIGSQLTKPLNPVGLTAANTSGTSIVLSWQAVEIFSTETQVDSTTKHFNIYKERQGTQNSPEWNPRPAAPYATVRYNDALTNLGNFTWIDRHFNTDPTVPAVTAISGWDFDPTDPGQYNYWVTAVNMQGTENTSAYWGHLSATNGNATITNTGGDAFTDDYIGMTISINGTDYTVETHPTANTLTIDPAFADATASYQFYVGPVTGRTTLIGNGGAEADPSAQTDDALNHLFNAQMIGTAGASLQDTNTTYGPANTAADGQPTYKWYFTGSNYVADDGAGTVAGVQGQWTASTSFAPSTASPPTDGATGIATTNDTWSIWEFYKSAGATAPKFTSDSGTAIGSIDVDPTAHGANDFCAVVQFADRGKFLLGQRVIMRGWWKTAGLGGSGGGVIKMQMVRYDIRNFSNAGYMGGAGGPAIGIQRDDVECSFALTTLSPDYAPYVVQGVLPKDNPTVSATSTSGSATVTLPNGDGTDAWLGCSLVLPGDTPREIINLTGGTGTTRTTLTLSSNAGVSVTNSASTVSIAFTHYFFKYGIEGVWDQVVTLRQPMVNYGLLGASWTSEMNHRDWPGGATQPTGTGGTGTPENDPNDPQPACVPPGTQVQTVDGPRAIEYCIPGTVLLSYTGDGSLKRNRVGNLNAHKANEMYTFTTSAHRQFMCSSTHPLAIWQQGDKKIRYEEARGVRLGDCVYVYEGGNVVKERIEGIELETGNPQTVYSLTMAGNPKNHFAGGVLCHNKSSRGSQN